MSLPLILALALFQAPTPAPTTSATVDFKMAPTVADPVRIAESPKIDGKMQDEEWDPFSNGTYLDWEPGVVYAAATGPAGQDLLLSLDLGGDGWLVGDSHLEARVSEVGGKPVITVRQLDATNKSGPVWKDLPGFGLASEAATNTTGDTTVYELKLVDPGLDLIPVKPGKIDCRIDLIPSPTPQADAYLPRSLSEVNLGFARAAALPNGLKWTVERNNRPVSPGDRASIRFTFNSKPPLPLKKLEIRSESTAKDLTNQMSVPFPGWDEKGRSYVDYDTRVDPSAEIGYRVLKATLTPADGTPGVIEASYRVAPVVDFSIVTRSFPADTHDRSLTFAYYLTSNVDRDVKGTVAISVPQGIRVVNGGDEHKFNISSPKGRVRDRYELFVPANSTGSYPVTFTVDANGAKRTYLRFVNVSG